MTQYLTMRGYFPRYHSPLFGSPPRLICSVIINNQTPGFHYLFKVGVKGCPGFPEVRVKQPKYGLPVYDKAQILAVHYAQTSEHPS